MSRRSGESALTPGEWNERTIFRDPEGTHDLECISIESSTGDVLLWSGRGNPVVVKYRDRVPAAALLLRGKLQPAHYLSLRDISNRTTTIDHLMRLMAQLLPSEASRYVAGRADVIMWQTDHELRLIVHEYFGTPSPGWKPLIGSTMYEFMRYHNLPERPYTHELALQGIPSTRTITVRGKTFETRIDPLYGPQGDIIGVVGLAVERTCEGAAVIDVPSGRILSTNQRFTEILRVPPDVVYKGDPRVVLKTALKALHFEHHEKRVLRWLAQFEDHPDQTLQATISLPDGRIVAVRVEKMRFGRRVCRLIPLPCAQRCMNNRS